MAVIGGLLILFGVALFVASLVAVFKPLPKLRMATRNAAGVGLALSVASCVVGTTLAPGTETAPVAEADADQRASSEVPTSAYEMSGEQVLARMNSVWSEQGQPGAFAVRTSAEVEAGDNKGSWTTNACVSSAVCALIQESPARKVTTVILIMGGDGDQLETLKLMNYQIGVIRIFEPEAEIGQAYKRQVDAFSSGETNYAEPIGDSCLSIVAVGGMGIWTTISRPPCD